MHVVGYDEITHAIFTLQIIWLLFNDSALYVLCFSKRNQEEFLIMPIVGI